MITENNIPFVAEECEGAAAFTAPTVSLFSAVSTTW